MGGDGDEAGETGKESQCQSKTMREEQFVGKYWLGKQEEEEEDEMRRMAMC